MPAVTPVLAPILAAGADTLGATWAEFAHGPTLWYVNRATGVVLVGLLTLATGIGVVSTARAGSVRWPRFATQTLHRNVSLLAMVMLAVHVTSAVVDTYVDIRWYEAFVPFVGRYEPWWLGVGTVSLDLLVVVVLTSLVRERLNHRRWRILHLAAYLAWAVGVAHGVGIGTDAFTVWGLSVNAVSVAVVAVFCVVRVGTLVHERRLTV
jgi:DMSO/TMAO reductase YedYZ heme-binding membrane subunit